MNFKKILLGIGLIIFGIVLAWCSEITMHNSSMGNILVTLVLAIIEIVILYLFVKAK